MVGSDTVDPVITDMVKAVSLGNWSQQTTELLVNHSLCCYSCYVVGYYYPLVAEGPV